jgi:hypothetical protein
MEMENGQNGREFVVDLERYGVTGVMEGIYWPVATYSRHLLAVVPNIEVRIIEQLCTSPIGLSLMTGVELCDLEGGWKEVRKVHKQFWKRIMAVPVMSANGACVKDTQEGENIRESNGILVKIAGNR